MWLLFGSFLLTGCLGSYELALGRAGSPSNEPTKDAGIQRDAKAPEGDAALRCSSDDECAGSVRRTCDPDAHVCYECNSNSDCQESAGLPHCDLATRECAACTEDGECRNGTRCQAGVCMR